MPIRRTPQGAIIRQGRIARTVTYDPAFGDALPSWLSVPNGTGTAQTVVTSTGPANYKVTASSAAIGGAARITLAGAVAIRADQYEEIEFTLQGLRFDSANGFDTTLEIGSTAHDRGISLHHPNQATGSQDTGAVLRAHNGATTTPHPTNFQLQKLDGGSQRYRNLTLLLRPRAKEAAVLEDDQVMFYTPLAAESALATTVQPLLTLVNTDAVQHWFSFARLIVSVRGNA